MREKPTEPPDLEQYSDVPLFNTKAVVRQTGIAAPTLRAWERRYTILSPRRSQNDYRLYSERDIALLGAWPLNRLKIIRLASTEFSQKWGRPVARRKEGDYAKLEET